MDKAKINYFVDVIAFVSFLVTAITGVLIFIFLPPGEGRGGVHSYLLGYGRHDWGAIHDWAGIIMTIAAIIHVVLHWKWIVGTTKIIFGKKQDLAS
jgi:hypothetical protein